MSMIMKDSHNYSKAKELKELDDDEKTKAMDILNDEFSNKKRVKSKK